MSCTKKKVQKWQNALGSKLKEHVLEISMKNGPNHGGSLTLDKVEMIIGH